MPLIDITNPNVVKFLVESYDKTTRLRIKWNQMHSHKLQAASTLHREERGYRESDVIKEIMIGGMSTITRDSIVAAKNRRLKPIRDGIHIAGVADIKNGHSIPAVGLGNPKEDPRLSRPDTDLSIDPKMRPVEPKQRKIMYKDIPVYGRKVYLKSRSKIQPEKKFYFRECSGWECGWRMDDSFFKNNFPKYGRVWRLTRDAKSLTGPQPDPPYYKSPDIPGPSKCF